MQDSLSFVAAVVLCACLLFVYPLQEHAHRQEQFAYLVTYQQVVRFVDDVCQKGFISKSMYSDFLERLERAGGMKFGMEMKHTRKMYVPNPTGGDSNIDERPFISYDDEYYDAQIVERLFPPAGQPGERPPIYHMHAGDMFQMVVTGDRPSAMQSLHTIFPGYQADALPAIQIPYGGMVKNEAH